MRAARFHAPGDLRIEVVADPAAGPGQVKLRNAYAGVCGTDVHMYFAPEAARAFFERPHPLTGASAPQVLGHEFSGTVVEIGERVSGVAVGDRAAVYPVYSCGRCRACESGRLNACRTIAFHGISSHGGGMAEFTVVDQSMLHQLPDGVDLRLGALVEPMAVAWHAAEVGEVHAGESALVAGAGPIGIGVWFALREHGVERVLVSEPNAKRRDAIAALGASVVDPSTEDFATVVSDFTGGAGIDLAFRRSRSRCRSRVRARRTRRRRASRRHRHSLSTDRARRDAADHGW